MSDEPHVAITLRAATSDEVLDILCRAHDLTPREAELARHLVNGLSTRQLAERLYIAPYTVKDHLKAMYRKVGVSTRGELVSRLTGHAASDPREPDDWLQIARAAGDRPAPVTE